MELPAVKYIIIIIAFILVGYIIFLLYKNINNLKEDVNNLKSHENDNKADIFDQFILDSNHLHSEVEENDMSDIETEAGSDTEPEPLKIQEIEDQPQKSEDQPQKSEDQPGPQETEESDFKKCESILKYGKNKGNTCGVVNCKKH